MKDRFQRNIDYLRISITDLCNLRCKYCMPEEGVPQKKHQDILSFEEIINIVEAVIPLGISKIRLTGGEPLVRKDLPNLIKKIAVYPEIKDISLTTNGVLLGKMAEDLKKCGLDRVNISLDSLDTEKYHDITRCGNLDDVVKGIHEALRVGLNPVKINVVVIKGWNDQEIDKFAALTLKLPVHVRFIELMPIGQSSNNALDNYLPIEEVKNLIDVKFLLKEFNNLKGNGPADYYKIPNALGTVGFIGALSNHFCYKCNRLRLTADGKIRPCLHKNIEFDLKDALRKGADKEEIRQIFLKAIFNKPKEHSMEEDLWGDQPRIMSQIGG